MKKIIFVLFSIFTLALFSKDNEIRVVPMSNIQWQSIQNQVNTNGYCHIKEQNVLLFITNGCPNIEYLIPIFFQNNIDLERNKLRMTGKRGDKKHNVEPSPYFGQKL